MLLLLPVTMVKIATSTSPRQFANASTRLPPFPVEIQGVHKGYSAATMQNSPLIHAHLLVFGYTEYKGKQKEIFDAAINGV
jgi:hypothetical protein